MSKKRKKKSSQHKAQINSPQNSTTEKTSNADGTEIIKKEEVSESEKQSSSDDVKKLSEQKQTDSDNIKADQYTGSDNQCESDSEKKLHENSDNKNNLKQKKEKNASAKKDPSYEDSDKKNTENFSDKNDAKPKKETLKKSENKESDEKSFSAESEKENNGDAAAESTKKTAKSSGNTEKHVQTKGSTQSSDKPDIKPDTISDKKYAGKTDEKDSQIKSVPKKKQPQNNPEDLPIENEEIEELASETEPDAVRPKKSFRSIMGKIIEIITAPEDNDLDYGEDENYEDIFLDEEQSVIEKADHAAKPGSKKKELPKSLTTSSLYTSAESKTRPSEKKKEEKNSQQQKTAVELPSDPAVQGELKEHIPYKPETKKKQTEPTSDEKNLKKHKRRNSGQSEITVDEILKAKNSVPERSAKAYGSMDTADKEEREKETEVPIFVNRQDKKKSSDLKSSSERKAYGKKTVGNKDFDLGELSYNNPQAQQKTDELSHDTSVKKSEQSKPNKTNELSHDAPAKQAEPLKSNKPNELSHDAPAKQAEPSKPNKLNNELSHDAPAKQTEPSKPNKPNELSHDAPAKQTEPQKQNMSDELSHDIPANNKEKTQKHSVSKDTADSMPGGQGVRIDPWMPAKKTTQGKNDFSENSSETIVYRSNETSPFVVMAGKFTRTLKNEYDNTRRIRESLPPDPPSPPSETYEERKAAADSTDENKLLRRVKSANTIQERTAHDKKTSKKPDNIQNVVQTGKEKNEKRKFKFSDIFTYEGDKFDEEEEEEEVKPELSDYGKEEDAEEIKSDISENFRKVFVRTIILTCTCAASVIAAVLAKSMPWIFLNMLKNGWLVYSLIMFVLFVISIFISRYPIVNGFMPLRKLRGNSDTPVAIASLAVAVQSIISLFQGDVFLNETYHIYVPLIILALLLNSMGKLLIIRRTADNFKFLRSKEARYAGKIYTNTANAERFVSGLPSRKPIIAYSKFSKFMSNFLQLSYAADPVEELSAFFAPIAAVLSIIGAVTYGIIYKDFTGGVSSFALSACITIPMCSLLAINIPMLNLCSSANRNGAMVVGYEAVKQFCDTNTIMIDSSDLYPKGSIILSGMKTINESKLQEAISAGASMTFSVNGPLTHVFETIVRQSKYKLPDFDSISYDDEMGLSGWCNGNRILVGRRELFEKHNIRLPDESIETKYRKRGNEIAYISVGGELAVMFILTYKADREIAQSLRNLEDSGVNFVVRTIDPNITREHIAEKFSLYPRCIKVLSTGLGNICHDELTSKEKTSRAYLVTNGKLSSFANAVAGCIRIKSTVTIAKIVQYLAIIIGFILVTIISFISGFAKLGSVELLLYTGFWCVALIAVSIAARKLS